MRKNKVNFLEFVNKINFGYLLIYTIIFVFILFELGVFPYKIMVIMSESMSPTIDIGDLVIYKDYHEELDSVNLDDIIVYKYDDGTTIIHRIIEKKSENSYRTKGDNAKYVDNYILTKDNIFGKYLFRIRWIGQPVVWLHNLFNKR